MPIYLVLRGCVSQCVCDVLNRESCCIQAAARWRSFCFRHSEDAKWKDPKARNKIVTDDERKAVNPGLACHMRPTHLLIEILTDWLLDWLILIDWLMSDMFKKRIRIWMNEWMSQWVNFSGRLRKNILFLQEWRFGRSRSWFWCQLKAHIRLPISPS